MRARRAPILSLDLIQIGTRAGDVVYSLASSGSTITAIPRISHPVVISVAMAGGAEVAVATPLGAGAADKQARMDAVIDEWSSETDSKFVMMKTLPSSTPVATNV